MDFLKFFRKKPVLNKEDNLKNSRRLFLEQQGEVSSPWASFEIIGFEDSGRMKIEFNWNAAFIETINALGFQSETEEDAVQLFFYTSQMKPTSFSDDEAVQADETPQLSSPNNRLVV